VSRNDPAAAGAMIEIFDDRPRVEERRSILEDQDRNLAERILPAQRIGRLHRVGPLDGDVALQAKQARRKPDLAAKRRGRSRAQNHHGRQVQRPCLTMPGAVGSGRRRLAGPRPSFSW
jgi:hypothetical protein